MRILA